MIPAIRAIGERIIEEKSPLVTIKDVPVIANKIEMSSRPEGRLCFTYYFFLSTFLFTLLLII